MTEEEARNWILARYGSDTLALLDRYVDLLLKGSAKQSLIAPSTLPHVWSRHIVDSLQLADLVPEQPGGWCDIGSGAGLPGLVIAALGKWEVTLVEPRRLRAAFLEECLLALGIRGTVEQRKAEQLNSGHASIISARAVTSLTNTLAAAAHLSTTDTLWLLPKGRGAHTEIATAEATWHGSFHVKQSIVDPASLIVVATGVHRR